MRIRIAYDTRYAYDTPARAVAQVLRLTPRNNDSQYVANWQVELDIDEAAPCGEDAFGNITHTFFTTRPVSHLTITVSGEVETTDTHGLLSGVIEPLPANVFLRETPLTTMDDEMRAFADALGGKPGGDRLTVLHDILGALHGRVTFDTTSTNVATSAIEAFAQRRGVCQDLTHIYIACARHLGMPARYVSGHLVKLNGEVEQQASHAWAETLVPDLGWVGFDVANGVSPSETHVRVACGFDYLSAAPVRGSRIGGGGEKLSVKLTVADLAQRQMQTSA
jgi:transglutaminase-like putative cysteine protease